MMYKQQTNCTEWQFAEIPEFKYGRMSQLFADCGTGPSDIPSVQAENGSFMHTFFETTAENVRNYAETLFSSGFEKAFFNCIESNLFYQFRTNEGLLYISFLKESGITRIILDRCKSPDVGSFGYSDYTEKHTDTKLAQYSLFYSHMIKGTTCDCGMNYVIRLRDNSLIIIDGGEMEQATDIAAKDYMKFLHEITETDDNEKLRISLWICTHAHNDHCDFFSKLIRFYSDKLTVERAAFNFPHPDNTRHSVSIDMLRKRLSEAYPNIDYIKLHAGAKFSIANAELEVLISAEEAIEVDSDDAFPGTNDTSIIFKVTAEGVRTLFLADCAWDNGSVLIANYDSSTTDSQILQAAHHGINSIFEIYDKLNTEKVLLPQCRMNMGTRFIEVRDYLNSRYGEENILYANDATDIFTLKDGGYTIEKRAQVGTAYDGSEW